MRSRLLEDVPSAKRVVSLRTHLIYPFVILIVVATILTGFLSLYNSGKATENMAWQLMDEITARIEDRVLRFLDKAHLVNDINTNTIGSGQIDLNNMREQELHFWHQVRSFDYISYSYIGRADGGFVGARRLADGTLQTIATETLTGGKITFFNTDNQGHPTTISSTLPYYDHKTRPWYKAGIEAEKPTWSPIFVDAGGEGLTITAATPLYDSDKTIKGVLGCSFIFSHINQFLSTLKIGKSGLTFIVERSGMLVATSTLDATYTADKKRIASMESENPRISQTGKSISDQFGDLSKINQKQRLAFQVQGERNFVQLSPLTDHRGIDWLIVVIIPENDFMSHIQAGNLNTILLSLLALGVTIAVGYTVARRITRPILELSIAARSLADGDWSQELKIDRWDEVGELARSFNHMVKNLQTTTVSRDRLAEEIEERNKVESELQKLAAVVEHSGELIGLAALDGNMIFLNGAGGIMLGIPPPDAKNHNIMEVIPDELKSKVENEVLPTLLKEGRWEGDLQYRNLMTGTLMDVHAMTFTIRNSNGEPLYLANVSLDITQRKRAEAAAQTEREKYSLLVRQIPGIVFKGYADYGLDCFDDKIEALTGYTQAEFNSRAIKWNDVQLEEYIAPMREQLKKALKSDGFYVSEFRIRKKSGELVWAQARCQVIKNAQGKMDYISGVFFDINEQKLAADAIARERILSDHIINSLPGIFYMFDDQGNLVRWNKKFEEVTGYSHEELFRMRGLDFFSEAHKHYIDLRVQSVLAEGEAFAEAPLLTRDGEQIPYFFTGRLTVLDGKQYVLGVGVDITERKRSDAERTLLATVVEQAGENVLITDDRRTILYINPAFERSSGYRCEDLKGQKLKILRSAQHDEAFYRNMKEILDRGEVWMGVIINKGRNGTDFEIEGTISPIRDASGSITHFVAVGRNMSRFRKLERELYQAQKMESVGRLAGGVAHDFNNTLTAILGHADLAMMRSTPSEPIYADLRVIKESAHRSADLVRQLLAFARKQTVAPKVLDVNDTVAGMLKILLRLIGEDIDLLWMPGADLWPVKIDPSQVDQLLANLCVNARDAIAGVGKVTIETENMAFDETYCADHPDVSSGEYVMIAVSDDGCGMSQEVLDHLFEPFFTTKEVGRGTGLGLATVYGIVKQNEGFINVYSETGGGTTFKIYLPRFAGEVVESVAESAAKTPKGSGETVLLVEDDAVILSVGQAVLEELGYRVLTADTPGEALRQAKAHTAEIQLLITDVVMPEMNGRDLANLIGGIKPGLKCLFISGYTANVIAHRGVLDEGVNFLQKPFSMKDMGFKVREVLESE